MEKSGSEPTNQHEEDVMRKLVMITVMAIAMVATISIGMVSADGGKKVQTRGIETMDSNALFLSNLRFVPGDIKVDEKETVTWEDVRTGVPHTITIVDPLPVNFAAAYTCLWDDLIPGVNFDGLCLPFLKAHGGLGNPAPVVNVGRKGLDTPGDSLFLPPNGSISAPVTAGPGNHPSLYVCHPSVDAGFDYGRGEKEVKDRPKRRASEAVRRDKLRRFTGSLPRL
jgi:hypothetical protein